MAARPAPTPPSGDGLQAGRVVATHGRHCMVETPDGARVRCHPRGKKLQAVVGDRVQWQAAGDEGTIEAIEPRRNLLYRQDALRTKRFAANLDQALILLAAEPEFSEEQLARALIACASAHITPLVALNKVDLAQPFERAWQRLAPYRALGCTVLGLAAGQTHARRCELPRLQAMLAGRTTLLLGPSGAGKSTLVNRLLPHAAALTGEISRALGRGRHTTTATTWYWLDAARSAALIDSPGFQEFGLAHIGREHLIDGMPDLKAHAGACRFYNCTHRHEPGCGVTAQLASDGKPGAISAHRYRIYCRLWDELGG